MEIRLLEPKDAKFYRKVRLEALKNNPESFSSSFEEEETQPIEKLINRLNSDHAFTFGAFEDKDLVGVVTLVLETRHKLKHRANIFAMYVIPEKQKSGIGKKLMLEAINKAREFDWIEQIYLSVTFHNEPAKKLYQSLGFQTYGIDKKALKIGEYYFDDELMVLKLK